ncbi:MAG: SUMF1/EgtB/PvdO family nonheme iron enzyme [Gammaproteobacteria bacterium]|nr:SUMF1/EgtB/PvdO family nonheme iron enzyme [Gammaproteobacteria bacterium]
MNFCRAGLLHFLLSVGLLFGNMAAAVECPLPAGDTPPFGADSSFPEPRVALVIGNSAYEGALSPLPNAANDALDLTRLLRRLGFTVICALNVQRQELLQQLQVLQRLTDQQRSDAVSLLFYAGHGAQIASENYLIPLQADLSQPDKLEREAVNLNQILQLMSNGRNREGSRFVILDACRDNPLGPGWGKPQASFSSRGLYWVFGTGYDRYAWDGGGRNGLFTRELLNHIPTAGATFEQVMKRVTAAVDFASGGVQVPESGGSLIRDFYFIPGEAVTILTPYPEASGWQPLLPLLLVLVALLLLSLLWFWRRRQAARGHAALPHCAFPPPLWVVHRQRLFFGLFLLLLLGLILFPWQRSFTHFTNAERGVNDRPLSDSEGTTVAERQHRSFIQSLAVCQLRLQANRLFTPENESAATCLAGLTAAYPVADLTLEEITAVAQLQQQLAQQQQQQIEAFIAADALTAAQQGIEQLAAFSPQSPLLPLLRQRWDERYRLTGLLLPVQGGCFQMGSALYDSDRRDDESPTQICVEDFHLGQYEVTVGQWRQLMEENPSRYHYSDALPVEGVSWQQAQTFIKRLNAKTGLHYRLPSEAEWEYACRSGGREEKFCGGNGAASLAWYAANSGDEPHPVAQRSANGLGFFDMSGNVWEWSCSRYQADYGDAVRCQVTGDDPRVYRGGAWNLQASRSRAAYRGKSPPDRPLSGVGFRLAR